MKIYIFFLLVLQIFFLGKLSFAATTNDNSSDPAYSQAKSDYHAYLEQLKTLRKQYREITSQVKQIVAEEGVPAWDEKNDSLTKTNERAFGDADIQETDKELIVKMDLPGVQKDQIKIQIQDNQILKVSGSRETESEEQKTTQNTSVYKLERQHGAFERAIKLPAPAQDTGTQAKYENGVLTVTIPKTTATKKEVTVSIQ